MEMILELFTAWLGSVGFCFLFHIRRERMIPASMGGLFSWGIYLLFISRCEGVFIPTLFASAFSALYAECLARLLKAPATIFFIPAVVPLIPGSTLYYTMSWAVQEEWEMAGHYGLLTVQYALGIAAGISLVWALCDMERKLVSNLRQPPNR